jgi:SAM-dependent methyltransferase
MSGLCQPVDELLDRSYPELVCPQHGAPLQDCGPALTCPHGHEFIVERRIPRVLCGSSTYADSFGDQWTRYRTTQLDSHTRTTISRDRLRDCCGPGLWRHLESTERTHVLEAGCGAGRFTEVLLSLPATFVTSTDLTKAVDANAANCPVSPRHRVVQCDINFFPFAQEAFDIVLCLGVIQHTPDPEAAIQRLWNCVRPGGWLIFDHYSASVGYYTKLGALLLRPIMKRLPGRTTLALTEGLVRVFFPWHRAARHSRLAQVALSRLSPVLTYYFAHPQLSDELQYQWALLDTHDSLTDFYKHFRSVAQIERTLRNLGALETNCSTGGNGVQARAQKPA